MKPAAFEYHVPRSKAEALALLAELGDEAKPLAGGQSLVAAMNFRLARPSHVVDLNRIPDLAGLRVQDGWLVIRAMTRQRRLEQDDRVALGWPVLVEACRLIGHVQIRNRGTVGGSLSHHDPAAELPAVMTALGAELVLESHTARRVVTPTEFFLDYMTTCLNPDELLTEVRVPALAPTTGTAFLEISRRHGDFALAGVATLVSLDGEDRVTRASAVLFGVAGAPVVCEGVDVSLFGRPVTEKSAREAAVAATHGLAPPSDIHATSEYRREVTGVLVRRALLAASRRAKGEAG